MATTSAPSGALRPPMSPPVDPIEYTTIALRVRLPNKLLKAYEMEAKRQDKQLEEVVATRIAECAYYTATKPLYFNDEQRRALEQIMCRNYSDPAILLQDLTRFYSCRVEDVRIGIDPRTFVRLKTRCHHNKPIAEFLKETILRLLREHVGS